MKARRAEKNSFSALSKRLGFGTKILNISPPIILFLCLLLTAVAVTSTFLKNRTEARSDLDKMAHQLADSVERRMEVYVTTLFHTRSFILANPNFSRSEFSAFVANLELKDRYPGIQGIAYAVRVDPKNLKKHIEGVRKEGFPDYKVWPESPRDEYFSILYIEPFDRLNQRAFGFDMHTEERRRRAMDIARDTGEPAMTTELTLVQETDDVPQKGFLIYLPIYARGAPLETVEQRRRALLGFVYSPFRAQDLFNEILQEENKKEFPVMMSVYFGDEVNPGTLLYSPLEASLDSVPQSLVGDSNRIEKIQLNGQSWTLVIQPIYWNRTLLSNVPWTMLVLGLLTSLFIYWIFRQAVRSSRFLQKSENQIRLIADAVPVLIAYVDLEDKYLFTNRTFQEWFGEAPDRFQWNNPEERAQILSGQRAAVDLEILHPSRGVRKVNRQMLPDIRRGRVMGFVILITDLTEEIQNRERIKEEQRISEIISDVGLKVTSELSLEKVVQAITDSATELTGAQFGALFYTVQNAQGQNHDLYVVSGVEREAFSKFPMPRSTDIFRPTFTGEKIVRYDDVTQEKSYGRNAPYKGMPEGHPPVRSYLAAPVKSKSGAVLGGLFFGHKDRGVFSERSEKLVAGIAAQAAVALDNAKLYEQAQQANRMKDEFLATLSHELRTPLNVIMGHAEILNADTQISQDVRLSVEAIYRNAQTQNQIINDLLDVSAIITGKMSFHPVRVNAVEIVQTAIDNIRLALDSKSISLVFEHEQPNLQIIADPMRLQQVIWNILSNAVKFTPRDGRIEIDLKLEGSKCVISVSDNGAGIEAEFLPYVFDRFRQEDSSFSRKYGGLGLGLSITRQLVEMHGGSIRASSAGKGQGTTFTLSLPIAAVYTEAPSGTEARREGLEEVAPVSPQEPRTHLDGVQVLVVDDEKDSRELVSRILQGSGAQVILASSAEEGFEELKKRKFDLIISDLGMPGEDGLHFIRRWRDFEMERNEFTPALVLTAFAQQSEKRKALSAGYQMHLSKPLQAEKLVQSVLKLVDF